MTHRPAMNATCSTSPPRHPLRAAVRAAAAATAWAVTLLLAAPPAQAHATRRGDVVVDHAYAPPASAAPATVYLRAVANRGQQPDRLLAAQTAVAASVELHQGGGADPARGPRVESVAVAPGAMLRPADGNGVALQLAGLKQALAAGQRFALRLQFERAGEMTVDVWVQTPQGRDAHAD